MAIVVSRFFARWNQLDVWLRQFQALASRREDLQQVAVRKLKVGPELANLTTGGNHHGLDRGDLAVTGTAAGSDGAPSICVSSSGG